MAENLLDTWRGDTAHPAPQPNGGNATLGSPAAALVPIQTVATLANTVGKQTVNVQPGNIAGHR
jgi:hypothetical protein